MPSSDIPTVAVKRETIYPGARVWTIDCPYCGREHTHAAEPGHRVSHCHRGDGYRIEAPKTSEAP